MSSYKRADFAPLRDTVYGLGFHWTTWTAPREGELLPFDEAVERFDVGAFVQQAVDCGAGHVLITSCHELQYLPTPNPFVEALLPGRTCKRDLLMEIADGLIEADIKFCLYYHHGTDGAHQDPTWWEACGAGLADQSLFYDNYCNIVGWIGDHFGTKVSALWFDAGYSLIARGDVPWERLTETAKQGNPNRLICYNSGIENHTMYTPLQDYWAGEVVGVKFRPQGMLTPAGLPWYTFTALHPLPASPDCGEWGINMGNQHLEVPAPGLEETVDYIKAFQSCEGCVTFNMLCYQDGTIYAPDLKLMKQVAEVIRK